MASSGPTPQINQVYLQQAAQDHDQVFEYLQGWRLHNLSGQSVTGLGHPHTENSFLLFRGNLPSFTLCPLALLLSLGTTGKGLVLSSLHPPVRYLNTSVRSHLECSLLFEWSQLPHCLLMCEMLHPLHHLGFLWNSLNLHVSLVLRSTGLDTGGTRHDNLQ